VRWNSRKFLGDCDMPINVDKGVVRRLQLLASLAFPRLASQGAVNMILQATSRLARQEGPANGDLEALAAAVDELSRARLLFKTYEGHHKVGIFGSARSQEGSEEYELARQVGTAIRRAGWMVITGAGPGLMQAVNEGAGVGHSFGLNIRLRSSPRPNAFISEDKHVPFTDFWARKHAFIREADSFIFFAGGFGTADEVFEVLTLMQMGKTPLRPIVLLGPPTDDYWPRWMTFLRDVLVARGYVKEANVRLMTLATSSESVVAEIEKFYSNYLGMCWVGGRLRLHVRVAPQPHRLSQLTESFRDIILSGDIACIQQKAGACGSAEIAFLFDGKSYGRLRILIDELNRDAPDGETGDGRSVSAEGEWHAAEDRGPSDPPN